MPDTAVPAFGTGLGCLWGFAASRSAEPWVGYDDDLSWVQKAGIRHDVGPFELYGVSLYVALNNIFGGR